MIYRTYYLSPLGRILLAADDIGLIGVWFEGQKYFGEFPGHMNYVFEEKENHILKDALRWLEVLPVMPEGLSGKSNCLISRIAVA